MRKAIRRTSCPASSRILGRTVRSAERVNLACRPTKPANGKIKDICLEFLAILNDLLLWSVNGLRDAVLPPLHSQDFGARLNDGSTTYIGWSLSCTSSKHGSRYKKSQSATSRLPSAINSHQYVTVEQSYGNAEARAHAEGYVDYTLEKPDFLEQARYTGPFGHVNVNRLLHGDKCLAMVSRSALEQAINLSGWENVRYLVIFSRRSLNRNSISTIAVTAFGKGYVASNGKLARLGR